jgi:hypothetical protein
VVLDKDDAAQVKQRKADDAKKAGLVGALRSKARALAELCAMQQQKDGAAAPAAAPAADAVGGAVAAAHPFELEALDKAMAELHKWAPPGEHVDLACKWHRVHGRYATAYEAVSEAMGKEKGTPKKEHLELKAALLAELGYAHWASAAKRQLDVTFPSAYPPVFEHKLEP